VAINNFDCVAQLIFIEDNKSVPFIKCKNLTQENRFGISVAIVLWVNAGQSIETYESFRILSCLLHDNRTTIRN
jgi:hypothetical protein